MARSFRVMVCGSSRFEDQDIVFGLLNGFKDTLSGDMTVISGDWSSGADFYTRQWAELHSVRYEALDIPDSDRLDLTFFDPSRELPLALIQRDPMLRRGYQRILQARPDVLLVIPNPDGVLGPTTACIMRMAKAIDLPCLDGAQALHFVHQNMESKLQSTPDQAPQEPATKKQVSSSMKI